MVAKICIQCNKTFYVPNYRKDTAKFCSYGCGGKYRYENDRSIQVAFKHDYNGSNHPQWKGGRTINTQGYVLIYSPNHPYKDLRNCVRQHRLVMEKHLGRYLLPNETVHHKNGNKQDNRLKNLQLLTKSEHDILHGKLYSEKAKARRIQKTCAYCKKAFDVPKSLSRIKCCSQSCAKHYQWETKGLESFGRYKR